MIRIIFFGTSSFAVPILERLASDGRFSVTSVVTQPDRPAGRKGVLTPPPIKSAALRLGLPVMQFEKVRSDDAFATLSSFIENLQATSPLLAVVASFGQIIPQRVLDLLPFGFINVHASILPAYRGASPIAAAIKNGDAATGVTIMKMDALMDHGPILATKTETIRSVDTYAILSSRLSLLGADLLVQTLIEYISGSITPREQEHALASTVKLLKREDGLIDWNQTAPVIERTVRAYDPWPGTYTFLDGKRFKLLSVASCVTQHASRIMHHVDPLPGAWLQNSDGPLIVCGDGSALLIKRLQPEGKSPMAGLEFLRGHPITPSAAMSSDSPSG